MPERIGTLNGLRRWLEDSRGPFLSRVGAAARPDPVSGRALPASLDPRRRSRRVAGFVRTTLSAGFLCCLAAGSAAESVLAPDTPADPLGSPVWADMHQRLLGGAPVVFDRGVRLQAPDAAEDSLNVPVFVDASSLPDVQRLLVFADLNPIAKVLVLEPKGVPARIGFRIKVQQSTPVRAAALTADGVWHLGGRIVQASGGGCTLPSVGSGDADWASRLGEVSGRLWKRKDSSRLRFRVMHPMDTGLVTGIPAFHIETLDVLDGEGEQLARISLFEPVSENPTLTLDIPAADAVQLQGRDNNGNRFLAGIATEGAR